MGNDMNDLNYRHTTNMYHRVSYLNRISRRVCIAWRCMGKSVELSPELSGCVGEQITRRNVTTREPMLN